MMKLIVLFRALLRFAALRMSFIATLKKNRTAEDAGVSRRLSRSRTKFIRLRGQDSEANFEQQSANDWCDRKESLNLAKEKH